MFIKKILHKLKIFRQAYFKKINKNFYSQFGEDKILSELFDKSITKGIYVDVGCFHPIKHSNTYLLYKRGWRGINIDIEKMKINVFNLARPNDLNILAAVSNKSEKAYVYKTQEYGVGSTLNKEIINKDNNIIEKFSITTKTLNSIIDNSIYKNKQIDLLNIDAEGNDFNVLLSINLDRYNPKVITIESHLKDINLILKSDIYKYLINKNFILRSWNFYSLIFVANFKT
jgi:FkbM family methyltransferase